MNEFTVNGNLPVEDGVYTVTVIGYGSNYKPTLAEGTLEIHKHAPADAVKENNVDSDCENAGGYDNVVYCTECEEELTREHFEVVAIGHKYNDVIFEANCVIGGWTERTCETCGDFQLVDKVPELGHDMVVDEGKEATCTETGLTEGKHCTRCDDETVIQEVIPELGHNWKDATTEVPKTCETCGATEGEPLPKPSEPTISVKDVFNDVPDAWYTEFVQYVYDNGLMTGIGGTSEFQPNRSITKAQVAQVLYNMEKNPVVTDYKVFDELNDVYDDWYADAVAWAYNENIITGNLNTKRFNPNDAITREQLAIMMYKYALYKNYNVDVYGDLAGLENADMVSDWAKTAMKWAVGVEIITGIDRGDTFDLAPHGKASRAQFASILQRFCEEYGL